jgi:DNA-binding NarL/FixJ family response regulator
MRKDEPADAMLLLFDEPQFSHNNVDAWSRSMTYPPLQFSPDGDGLITVVLAQFGAVIGRGLRGLLDEDRDLSIVGEELDCAALELAVAESRPRVAVLGETTLGGRSLLRRLWAVQPDIGLVVLVHRPTRAHGARLLESGVAAYLPLDAAAHEILSAIHLAAVGLQVLLSAPNGSLQATHVRGMASLTPRERDVLRGLSQGESNVDLGRRLHISTETVRTHVKHIFRKLGVDSRRELIDIPLPQDRAAPRYINHLPFTQRSPDGG